MWKICKSYLVKNLWSNINHQYVTLTFGKWNILKLHERSIRSDISFHSASLEATGRTCGWSCTFYDVIKNNNKKVTIWHRETNGDERITLITVLVSSLNFGKERKLQKTNKDYLLSYIELDESSLTLQKEG